LLFGGKGNLKFQNFKFQMVGDGKSKGNCRSLPAAGRRRLRRAPSPRGRVGLLYVAPEGVTTRHFVPAVEASGAIPQAIKTAGGICVIPHKIQFAEKRLWQG
jgi:hypothetical protein